MNAKALSILWNRLEEVAAMVLAEPSHENVALYRVALGEYLSAKP